MFPAGLVSQGSCSAVAANMKEAAVQVTRDILTANDDVIWVKT